MGKPKQTNRKATRTNQTVQGEETLLYSQRISFLKKVPILQDLSTLKKKHWGQKGGAVFLINQLHEIKNMLGKMKKTQVSDGKRKLRRCPRIRQKSRGPIQDIKRLFSEPSRNRHQREEGEEIINKIPQGHGPFPGECNFPDCRSPLASTVMEPHRLQTTSS